MWRERRWEKEEIRAKILQLIKTELVTVYWRRGGDTTGRKLHAFNNVRFTHCCSARQTTPPYIFQLLTQVPLA